VQFSDRADAGRRLARRLDYLRGGDVVVLGLPRGGVPVAFEVARALGAPLDVIVVRKLGAPFQPELAMGAVGEGGVRVTNDDLIRRAGITADELAAVERRELADLALQASRFRAGRPHVDLAGKNVIVVDDGIATGSTASAACQVARGQGAETVIMAAPVGAPESVEMLRACCDEVVCLEAPPWFSAVGTWYADFSHVLDAEVTKLLARAASALPAAPAPRGCRNSPPSSASKAAWPLSGQQAVDEAVEVQAGPVMLAGQLTIPVEAGGIVVFVHGSGSSRHSPRNRYVATQLNEAGFGTLLFDLLTAQEELDRANVFDVETLASRLTEVTCWLRSRPDAAGMPVGYFGASTGAAAALWAAAGPAADVAAVVSRGGRPDLAAARLPAVLSPTLLIVGGRDEVVLGLNKAAQRSLRCQHRLAVVPGATHLFEEPGTLRTVTRLARDWFGVYFEGGPGSRVSLGGTQAAPPS
jgi:putative phosphoribosyl transferase